MKKESAMKKHSKIAAFCLLGQLANSCYGTKEHASVNPTPEQIAAFVPQFQNAVKTKAQEMRATIVVPIKKSGRRYIFINNGELIAPRVREIADVKPRLPA